jgi:protein involved in polysaccharide export with SLBB domain
MHPPQWGRRKGSGVNRAVCIWSGGRVPLVKWGGLLLLLCSFAGKAVGQSNGSIDCTDPLLATIPACSSPPVQGAGVQGSFAPPGSFGVSPAGSSPSGNPYSPGASGLNYSDVEQLTSKSPTQSAPLPPEPLTELQKFVASTTGLVLPVYGADLFRNIPSTFAPIELAPVPADYVVGPGDELRIRVWGQISVQANVRVDRSGEIYLPQVGQIHVAGLAFSELDTHLRQAVGRVYHNFDLTVDVGQIRAIQVYVSGEARRPGVYTVSSLSTLVDALFSSGGPSVEGSLRTIELRRGGTVVTRFDLYDLLIRGDKTKDAKLLSGDVIFIPPVGPQAAIVGSVRNPAIYELQPQETLGGILADAGGVSAVAAEARVSIERIDEHRDRRAIETAYDSAGLATPLADGDIIRLYSIVPRYQKTVTLRGNTANPGRFAWHEGMRVSELIPDKDSLLTRNYWWRRAQMGLPAPEFEPLPGLSSLSQPADNRPAAAPQPTPQQTLGGLIQPSTETERAAADSQGQYNSPQNIYGAQPGQISAQQQAGSTPLAAQEVSSVSQPLVPTARTEVQIAAPEIDWDYAVVERLDPATLKTTLLSFDLGKLILQHDATQDLALEPGDVLTIFSQADINVPVAEQTKLVRLDGEFVHAGVYSVQPGETLRHLVERAGGLTANAYLYASEFTRVSTRAVQQARINEYVQTLSMAIQRNAVNYSTTPVEQAAATGSLVQANEQSLLASLRQIRATGRIVLSLQPASSGVENLPNITLEDGDRLVVPHVPAAVNVVGAVYDQNSFLYSEGSRAGRYLHRAGGINRDADGRHEFIIRADGEVVSRDTTNGPWGSDFNGLRIYPGDTIVVPEKIVKPSPLYGLLNWSQMFSQLALGAAAINVIQ